MAMNWDSIISFNNSDTPLRKPKQELQGELPVNSIKLEGNSDSNTSQPAGNNILTAPAMAMNTETTYNTVQTTMPSGGGISTTAIQASRYRFGLR